MTFPVIPRRSTTLMLAVRHNIANQQAASSSGYKLLMLQRSSTSRFMPNRYVFPGGVSEATDFSPEWLDLIGNRGLPLKPTITNAPFYKSYTNQLPRNSLPPHIGFRICAIRETFEESGVLLVRFLSDNAESHSVNKILSDNEIRTWRGKVHSNSSLFIQLCRDIQCVPDIWSLYDWSNWITPTYSLQRFDTMFYLAFLDNKPEMSHDGEEVTSSTWINPEESIMLHVRNKLIIAPPQFYEMSRLCRFSTIDELKTFAMSIEGVEAWEAVTVNSCDGNSIYFLPGDNMYEQLKRETLEHYENLMKSTSAKDFKRRLPFLQVPQTTEELFVKASKTNRVAINYKTLFFKAECTAKLKYNMPTPSSRWKANL